ncbi:hypothetical protein [Amycolatopsis thermoflava]
MLFVDLQVLAQVVVLVPQAPQRPVSVVVGSDRPTPFPLVGVLLLRGVQHGLRGCGEVPVEGGAVEVEPFGQGGQAASAVRGALMALDLVSAQLTALARTSWAGWWRHTWSSGAT